jgi:hypothetical protein
VGLLRSERLREVFLERLRGARRANAGADFADLLREPGGRNSNRPVSRRTRQKVPASFRFLDPRRKRFLFDEQASLGA